MKFTGKLKDYMKMSSLRQEQGHKSVPRQFAEMGLLFALRGIGPGYYHAAQLWHKDKTWTYKLGWLSEAKYRKRVYQYNPRPYQKISQNKLPEKALLTLFHIPTAEFLGFYHPVHGRDQQGSPLRCGADMLRLLEARKLNRFCIKELEGWGGRGFQALEVVRSEKGTALRPMQGAQVVSVEDYFEKLFCPAEGLAIEAYIHQHPVMRSLNPTSLNTIRVIVVWPHQEDYPRVVGGFVRIGRAGSLVDNTTAGGLCAPVEIQTGRIGRAHLRPPHPDAFKVHPDHGAQIEGTQIPCWDEAKDLLQKTMPVFPFLRFCGFDVAIAVDGPKIVELNVEPDKTGLMQIGLSMNEVIPEGGM